MKTIVLGLFLLVFQTNGFETVSHANSNSLVNATPDTLIGYAPLFNRYPKAGVYNHAEQPVAFDMIKKAKKTIDIEIYEMQDPDILDALSHAIDRGVKVRVIKDPTALGEACDLFAAHKDSGTTDPVEFEKALKEENCDQQFKLKAKIEKSGGRFVGYNKAELCPDGSSYCYMHGKMIITDRKVAAVSTGNLNSTGLCNLKQNPDHCNRDFSVVTQEGGAVEKLFAIFERDLLGLKYNVGDITSRPSKQAVTVSPMSMMPLVALIYSANKTIRLQNQYVTDPTLQAALKDAASRGVKVYLTLASVCAFGEPSPSKVKGVTKTQTAFDEVGIKTSMFTSSIKINGKPGYQHSKVIIIDDKKAWVGSVNGSTNALNNNREFGLMVEDSRSVKKLVKQLKADFINPESETWQESLACKKDKFRL